MIEKTYEELRLEELIRNKKWKELADAASQIHPHDMFSFLCKLKKETQDEVLVNLDHPTLAKLIPEFHEEKQLRFVMSMTPKKAAELLMHFRIDKMVDILKKLPRYKRIKILRRFQKRKLSKVGPLLKHPSDTAGGLMTTEFLSFVEETTVKQAINRIRKVARDFETVYYIYVTDKQGELVGIISLQDLVLAPSDKKLRDVMGKNVIWVREDTDQEEVAKIAADYDIAAVPVVDSKKRLVGIVTVDDVIDVIQEEAAEDLGFLAGTGKRLDKLIEAPTWTVAKYRLPWLIFALIGNGIVAAYVLKIFEQTLASVIALALFIPVIMTMGGNVGVQSSTIFVRGIATGDIRDAWNYFFRELRIGLMIALVICVGITIAAYILVKRPILGMIVGTSMFLTIILASTIGVIIPKILDWIGVDPAVASNPFITTFQDIMSLFVYFGLATLMLHYLI